MRTGARGLSSLVLLSGLASLLLMTGCAETHPVFRLGDGAGIAQKIWPPPPERPRYRYLGELTGEENFTEDDGKKNNTALKVFNWLVGLTGFGADRVVLQRPQSGAVDEEGRVYITDVSRRAVYVFDKPGGKLQIWDMARADTPFDTPVGIALGANGQILVADAALHSVFRLGRDGQALGEFGREVLKRPTGLARDAATGRVYVADTYAHDIKVFNDGGQLLKVIGRRGDANGEFNFPTYLAYAAGRLYVTDSMNSRIQELDSEGKPLFAFGHRGLYVGNMVRPKGVAVDREGDIYVVESFYDKLLVFDRKGRTLLALGSTGKEAGQFFLPAGVWTDKQDRVYVADMFNGRVVVLQFLGGGQ